MSSRAKGRRGAAKGGALSGTGDEAADEIRTRDPELGKLVLYQLSYHRTCKAILAPLAPHGGLPTHRRPIADSTDDWQAHG
jgi:hypothetical protein